MKASFRQFLWLSWPFIMGWVLLSLHIWAGQISELHPALMIKTSFLADFDLPIPTVSAVRIIITLLSGLFFAYPAFRDYSSIFPQNLRMEIFFDDAGISETMNQFSEGELPIRIAKNWSAEKNNYFETFESKLRVASNDIPAPKEFTFRDPSCHVFTKGSTSFVVNKAEGFQRYKIVSSRGIVVHCCEKEGVAAYDFSSEFELLDTSSNWITVPLWNIYLPSGWTYILSPSYKQIYRNNNGERVWDHTLLCVTKIRYFPVPSIGRSLCLYRPDPLSSYMPIGYTVYDRL